jgi:alpha-beta hydrolase superfamily lysophospholipase
MRGLGEHIGRCDYVVKFLNDSHFNVVGYDLYGHGKSEGVRGCIRISSQHLDDLFEVVDDARRSMPDGLPLILPGHSMGGLIADFISHDGGVVATYDNRPLVHDRISGLLAKFIADAFLKHLRRSFRHSVSKLCITRFSTNRVQKKFLRS